MLFDSVGLFIMSRIETERLVLKLYTDRDKYDFLGFATEIALRLVLFGFETAGLKEVFATVDKENLASIHVLEKSGLEFYRKEYDEQGVFFIYRLEYREPLF
jgi:hypothetical protein